LIGDRVECSGPCVAEKITEPFVCSGCGRQIVEAGVADYRGDDVTPFKEVE
jgi:hypothetical protein